MTTRYINCGRDDVLVRDPHAIYRVTLARDNRIVDVLTSLASVQRSWVSICRDVLEKLPMTNLAYPVHGAVAVTDDDTSGTIDVKPSLQAGAGTVANLVTAIDELSAFVTVESIENTGHITGSSDIPERETERGVNTQVADDNNVGDPLGQFEDKVADAGKNAARAALNVVYGVAAIAALGVVVYFIVTRRAAAAIVPAT